MVIMPDGAKLEMQWKQVKYSNRHRSILFDILPMYNSADVVVFPNIERWSGIVDVFSHEERLEIIFLLERIKWKRDVRVAEANITPVLNSDFEAENGSLQSTAGYRQMAAKNLFDPPSSTSKSEVKEIYYILEKRFAENASGLVTIPKNIIFSGSILEKISIPALKKNKKVTLNLI